MRVSNFCRYATLIAFVGMAITTVLCFALLNTKVGSLALLAMLPFTAFVAEDVSFLRETKRQRGPGAKPKHQRRI
jgi:uncharacterized membrane protein